MKQFNPGKAPLSNRGGNQPEDLVSNRSLRSEFDYGSKKKFVDVLGNVNTNAHLNRLRQEHALQAKNGASESEAKVSYNSYKSANSATSKLSKASLARFREMKKAKQAKMPTLNE